MENYFELLGNDLKKLWGALDFPKKALIVLLSLAAVGAISFIISKSTEPQWSVLYSDLSETDSIAITQNLKEAGYMYKMTEDRKTILVPGKVREELRLLIAEQDLIQDSNPGFQLLSKMQFGSTEFQNKLTRQKIFQDEITRTIQSIRGVSQARVQIAEPDRSVFADRDERPTASVMLILDGSVRLKTDQIKAIKNIVAYGIPRLTPERVFVSDQNGISLTDEIDETSSGLTDYKKQFEVETAGKIQKVLQKIVGIGNVSVEVSADMNFDRSKKTVEKYLPVGQDRDNYTGVLASARDEIEKYGKGKNQDNSSELPDVNSLEGVDKNTDYQKSRTSRDYNVSKEIEQIVYAPGKVEKMSIAVALNRILTAEQREEIRNLVASASGANVERGDKITITGMQFAPTPGEEAEPLLRQMQKNSTMEFIFKQVGPLVVILILGIGALVVLNSLLKKPLQGEEVYGANRYYEEFPEEDTEIPDLLSTTAPMPSIEANLDPEVEKMRGEINSTIVSDPSEAARLLLSYIKD